MIIQILSALIKKIITMLYISINLIGCNNMKKEKNISDIYLYETKEYNEFVRPIEAVLDKINLEPVHQHIASL